MKTPLAPCCVQFIETLNASPKTIPRPPVSCDVCGKGITYERAPMVSQREDENGIHTTPVSEGWAIASPEYLESSF